ncbi:hypothetical protein HanXRQr2_Chr15g0705451 [Helianthus annuus]|uniref:Uncharacterized protein n=1 Tax=Helianthus annuus TaxID=4232 RepID=A0A251SVT5_HELAN|nr:hypothetical protein HanXRQr2_Chr15g0705451 [Helianthus annuus]KAJ0473993.1 hypothetical protein HanHA89_Chr15g0624701 [Helianthus annuus]KAJ0832289.1 hypothetical protein HanPSC8_Chr15g0677081 [Helianthus annuus]
MQVDVSFVDLVVVVFVFCSFPNNAIADLVIIPPSCLIDQIFIRPTKLFLLLYHMLTSVYNFIDKFSTTELFNHLLKLVLCWRE